MYWRHESEIGYSNYPTASILVWVMAAGDKRYTIDPVKQDAPLQLRPVVFTTPYRSG